ncbi:N-terminal domain of NEFA-interacting nuclear protein NIP30-domain-containing protein [Plectosphaerella plurivora]|uniref:N-terminal domain of NEFA-interacting nuclear protein NIP30-domain-containing protein n=1 Tax=Plectosphaerella plurivora TaxID=936078 RepID=A0A9P9AG71_9PEZI|nr:N-terminal domain of NEFA-interacting nuclear protein NIP30-domain-containing protein [Plectosphaerella plurivora]
MSSRFVSGGKIDAETGENVAPSAGEVASTVAPKVNAEWEAVQKELDAERQRREEARKKAVEGGEQSLYDILQANKAAKQAAFEEQNKLKNQFRALDDDEIDFLDDVKARERREEEKVRMETSEGLKAFREAQKAQEKGEGGVEEITGDDEWAAEWKSGGGKKRKRHVDGVLKGVVKRRTSEAEGSAPKNDADANPKSEPKPETTTKASPPAPVKAALGLGDYDSDSDD